METIQDRNEKILGKFDGCREALLENFGDWIERNGGWDVWIDGKVLIQEVTHGDQPWPVPVPFFETQFGNYTWDPDFQKWINDDELFDLIEEYR